MGVPAAWQDARWIRRVRRQNAPSPADHAGPTLAVRTSATRSASARATGPGAGRRLLVLCVAARVLGGHRTEMPACVGDVGGGPPRVSEGPRSVLASGRREGGVVGTSTAGGRS